MNAKPPTSGCDAARLEIFLCGEMSGAEEYEFTLHLDACERCRTALAEQAAEPAVWQEARELLGAGHVAIVEAGGVNAGAGGIRDEHIQIESVLDALGPTDDPEMLGRLGGYEVSGIVGAGGMGVVLKAIDPSLDRTVAIKVLAPHLASSGSARKRFAREAKAAAAVLHPNVIAIHSVSTGEALPYLVMPYVRGPSLQKRLDREGSQSLQEILRIGAQIASGLAAAHAQGLVHRDIKPANILLEEGIERVTITDFGLARAVDDATLTHSGMIAGTPQYMSPEQARGEAVDARSDLFSLGSLLYAVCTGRPPFRAETSYGVMRRITDEEPRPIHEINPDIPRWLSQLIDKLMSKQAVDRFPSAAEVAELLEACLAHVQQPTVAELPPELQPAAGGSRKFSLSRRSSGVIAMFVALGLGILGLFAWQATEAPDIAGSWSGEEWGQVALKRTGDGEYTGAYSDASRASPGTIKVKWSRLERRFKGNWREEQKQSGKISLRLVEDDEIRGAWTTSKNSHTQPGAPELADLTWKRSSGAPPSDPESTPATKTQVKIAAPQNMAVVIADQRGDFGEIAYKAPARLNLASGKIHRLKLSHIAGREGAEFYPTVEIDSATSETEAFLTHNAITFEFTEEDFDQALAGNFVTKVVYLPDPEFRDVAVGVVETVVSTRLDPGTDPIAEADRRGSILAVIRLGNKDVELPDGATVMLGGVKAGDPESGAAQFSEPKVIVLSLNSMKFMLDLDTGATMDPPAAIRPEQGKMDLHTNQVQPYHFPTALIGLGLSGMEMKESDWHASADAVRLALNGVGVEPLKEMDLGPEKHPTYFFKTREGACGVLQLLEVVDKPKGIRLRYKTIEDKPTSEQRGEVFAPKQIVENGQKLYHSRQPIVVRMKVAANKPITVVDEKGSQQQHWNLLDADTPEFSILVTNDGQNALLKGGATRFPKLFVGQWIEVEGTVQAVGLDIISRPDTTWTYHVELNSLDQVSFPPSETSGAPAHR